ncbi:MAG TPA: hypothetical protein VK206_06835 [Anaerolineales bacterium]|nr:hypothetical protein [Anaerolineales bacterium]
MKDEQSPQAEALDILKRVINDLTNPPFNLKANLRRCQHVCEILGWQSKRDWFHQEVNGYYPNTPLPDYRKIQGTRQWAPSGSEYESIGWKSEEFVYGVDTSVYDVIPDVLEVRAGIDWLSYSAQYGYTETLGETKEVSTPSRNSRATLQRKRIFPASNITYSLSQIEKHVFDFASISYAQLRFGDIIGDIWGRYRRDVDAAMSSLNLVSHLRSIEGGLLSENPEDWRSAAFECRNLLNDLATYLWQDARPRYEYLKGDTDEGTLDVSQGKFGNRIAAYIHQKGVTGTRGKFIRDEAQRLATSILSLIPFQSEAHEPIQLADAQSIAIATYILTGELARRTDLKPVEKYGIPAISTQP